MKDTLPCIVRVTNNEKKYDGHGRLIDGSLTIEVWEDVQIRSGTSMRFTTFNRRHKKVYRRKDDQASEGTLLTFGSGTILGVSLSRLLPKSLQNNPMLFDQASTGEGLFGFTCTGETDLAPWTGVVVGYLDICDDPQHGTLMEVIKDRLNHGPLPNGRNARRVIASLVSNLLYYDVLGSARNTTSEAA